MQLEQVQKKKKKKKELLTTLEETQEIIPRKSH